MTELVNQPVLLVHLTERKMGMRSKVLCTLSTPTRITIYKISDKIITNGWLTGRARRPSVPF